MKVHHTLICFFLTALQETDLINAETFIRTGTEGGNMTVTCRFNFHGSKKIFCKNECTEDKDILIKTGNNRAQSGRYSIEYEGLLDIQSPTLNVTITQLTKSDSGRYWCGLGRTVFPNGYYEIDLRVTDASPSSSSHENTKQSETSFAGSGYSLALVVCVHVVVLVLLAVVLLLPCKKRDDSHGSDTRRNSEHIEMEDVVYENCPPASTHQDSIYQSLDPASRDHDQTYSTLTHTQQK